MKNAICTIRSHPELHIIQPADLHINGIIHPLSTGNPTYIKAIGVDGIITKLDVYTIVSILPSIIPGGIVSRRHVIIRHLVVVVGVSDCTQVKIGRMDDSGNRMWICKRAGFIRIHLSEHRIYHIFLNHAIFSLQSFGNFHERINRKLLRGCWSTSTPVIQ